MRGRKFSGLCRGLGLAMDLIQGKIAKHKTQTLAKVLLNALDDRISAPTMGTLVVSVLHQGAWCVGRAFAVIFGADRYFELRHCQGPPYFGYLTSASLR